MLKPARKSSRPIPSALIGNAWALSDWRKKYELINQAGVRMAREAAATAYRRRGRRAAGHPSGAAGATSFAEARAIFREQVRALIEAGVDLLVLETFYGT